MNRYVIQLKGKDVGSHESLAHAQLWAECIGATVWDREALIDFEEIWS